MRSSKQLVAIRNFQLSAIVFKFEPQNHLASQLKPAKSKGISYEHKQQAPRHDPETVIAKKVEISVKPHDFSKIKWLLCDFGSEIQSEIDDTSEF